MLTHYYAQWIVTQGNLLHNGVVSVCNERISYVGTRSGAPRHHEGRIVRLGNCCLIPGFINIHTHLEQGVLRGIERTMGEGYTPWLLKNNNRLFSSSGKAIDRSILLGAREMLMHGITTVVDSSTTDRPIEVLGDTPLRILPVIELIQREKMEPDRFLNHLHQRYRQYQPNSLVGAGPSTLFSLQRENLEIVLEFCHRNDIRLCMHLAESAEELEAFSEQSGDLFAATMHRLGWQHASKGQSSASYALHNGYLPRGSLIAGGSYLSTAELQQLQLRNISVAWSPRFNEYHQHKPFALQSAITRNVRLCVCTESISRASSCSVLDELLYLRRMYPYVPPMQLLDFVTRNPAEALGLEQELGDIKPNCWADIIGFKLRPSANIDVVEEIIQSDPHLQIVVYNGQQVLVDQ